MRSAHSLVCCHVTKLVSLRCAILRLQKQKVADGEANGKAEKKEKKEKKDKKKKKAADSDDE